MPVEELGLLYPDGEIKYSFHPFKLSAEGEKKLMEELESIRQEKGEEAAKEFISDTPKTGVVRVDDEYLDDMSYTDVELADGKDSLCRFDPIQRLRIPKLRQQVPPIQRPLRLFHWVLPPRP